MKKERKPFYISNSKEHPIIQHARSERSMGQILADIVTKLIGSWTFIITIIIFLFIWIATNIYIASQYNLNRSWDPYPFILLNLIVAILTAIQVPIILMSQNRQEQIDRIRAEYDYTVDRKAEREIEEIKKQLDRIERKIK